MGTTRLVLRATIGALFVGHGLQKLTDRLGGSGPAETGRAFESAGLRPGRQTAVAAGATEAGGGLLLAFGLATPAAAAALASVMFSAIRHVHWRNGPWSAKGGYEYNLTILAALAALVEEGPGPLSLDAALGIERRGPVLALAALGAGAAGSLAASALSHRAGEIAETDPERTRSDGQPVAAGARR